jgi:hypothetical protein
MASTLWRIAGRERDRRLTAAEGTEIYTRDNENRKNQVRAWRTARGNGDQARVPEAPGAKTRLKTGGKMNPQQPRKLTRETKKLAALE